MKRALVVAACAAAIALAVWFGAMQLSSMSTYGDLATRPSLPAFLNARFGTGWPGAIVGPFARAQALVHAKQYAAAEQLLETLPHDRDADDLRGDVALGLGHTTQAFDWYVRAGDTLRAQAIVDTAFATQPKTALAAQLVLVRTLENGHAAGDLTADAWWKLGELQRAAADAGSEPGGSAAALHSFEHALETAPNRKSYLLAASVEALKLANYDEAERYLTHAIEVGPGNANAYGLLALVEAAKDDCARAVENLDLWRTHSPAGARPPDQDPRFGATLRACSSTAAVGAAAPAASARPPVRVSPTSLASAAPAGPAEPKIVRVTVAPTTLHSFSNVSGGVQTSPDVVSVAVSVVGVPAVNVPRLGPGRFGGSLTLPDLPAFVHGWYAVTFTATNGDGRTASSAVWVDVP